MEAVTIDFFQTLAFHRGDRGRGRELTEYIEAAGYSPRPWEHEILYRVFKGHLHEYSPTAPGRELLEYRRGFALRAFGEMGITIDAHEAARHADAVWEIMGPGSFELYPEVRDVLGELTGLGVRLAVISNWQSGLVHFLHELGILPFFRQVYCSYDIGFGKPEARIFQLAAAGLGVPPAAILHVGDTYTDDYEGSRDAGFSAVLVARGRADLPQTAHVIEDLRPLPQLVAGQALGPMR